MPHSGSCGQLQQPDASASCAQLRKQLHQSQRALKRTGEHLRLQETRSRQLVTACEAKLRERQADAERQLKLKDRQFQLILQQLALLQSRLKREQKVVTSRLSEHEQLTQQQARELERLRRTNRRLVGKVNRLSEPCSRCGAKPDSGISDCDEADESAAKVARRVDAETACDSVTPTSPAARLISAGGTAGGGSCSSRPAAADSDPAPASPPGIMKVPHEQRPAAPKTVTFSLQDNDEPDEYASEPSTPPPVSKPLQPRIITPPSVNINGKTYGQPSIVDTISQLLGADLEWPAVRRPALVPKKLSVIPEGNESSRDEQSEPEYENVRVETLGEVSAQPDSAAAKDGAPTDADDGDKLDNDSVQSNNYRNVPRSRSNINLIMSESEGVQIKDNFEEFKFDDDMSSSVCSDSASDRSADNGSEENQTPQRRAGDGAESEQTDTKVIVTNGNYEKFLELSGLSQKALRTSVRMFTNHRSVLRPKDVKYRHRVRMTAGVPTIESMSPTSVRYYSEQL